MHILTPETPRFICPIILPHIMRNVTSLMETPAGHNTVSITIVQLGCKSKSLFISDEFSHHTHSTYNLLDFQSTVHLRETNTMSLFLEDDINV
jgi:hypothetical protein